MKHKVINWINQELDKLDRATQWDYHLDMRELVDYQQKQAYRSLFMRQKELKSLLVALQTMNDEQVSSIMDILDINC